jgi:MFS family permease
MALLGGAYIGVLAGCNTVVQLNAPPALRGRMLGLYMTALGVIYPLGAILQGALADRFGLRQVTAGGALLLLAGVVAAVALGAIPSGLEGPPVATEVAAAT